MCQTAARDVGMLNRTVVVGGESFDSTLVAGDPNLATSLAGALSVTPEQLPTPESVVFRRRWSELDPEVYVWKEACPIGARSGLFATQSSCLSNQQGIYLSHSHTPILSTQMAIGGHGDVAILFHTQFLRCCDDDRSGGARRHGVRGEHGTRCVDVFLFSKKKN